MPVHWSGKICDMKNILKISKKYKIPIVEDLVMEFWQLIKIN